MIILSDGRGELYQWDTGREVSVGIDVTQVHFSNKIYGISFDVDVVGGVATIPNFLLTSTTDLKVWAFSGVAENGYTKHEAIFKVKARNKPHDYVFDKQSQITIKQIEAIANEAMRIAQSVRDDADNGQFDGFSPLIITSEIDGGHRVDVTDENGTQSFNVWDGKSGVVPKKYVNYAESVIIEPNVCCEIDTLAGDINIDLAQGTNEFDNEWIFILKQGTTEHDVVLPDITWTLDIQPVFEANTITEVRIHKKGEIFEGVWL